MMIKKEKITPPKLHNIILKAIKHMKAPANQIEVPVTYIPPTLLWSIPKFSVVLIFANGLYIKLQGTKTNITLQAKNVEKSESGDPIVKIYKKIYKRLGKDIPDTVIIMLTIRISLVYYSFYNLNYMNSISALVSVHFDIK